MNNLLVISCIVGLIVMLLLIGAPLKPIRFVGGTIVKILLGAIFLFVLNMAGSKYGLHVPINAVTASITGILGIPGIIALAVIQLYIIPL
ncbi:pro-sigmaK processing inhibitor BofA family protein [Ectobacillus sp. JY-23]|uniref:pro-sigmaK processing inhibitor BofA family protein n=1 Tax=Ectobacillus sp. JY-23 TaxID=2933872 RepID=UPI001FF43CE6|nr:pro-sigmaK processing inhibitor BofA family protein [Ectobacillus sp. JY-23]UOY91396.1 pro-sigmaK processing inhibitor BofA family protein [Ectobacillus sp. JY-23]